jgi:hypothetical protein
VFLYGEPILFPLPGIQLLQSSPSAYRLSYLDSTALRFIIEIKSVKLLPTYDTSIMACVIKTTFNGNHSFLKQRFQVAWGRLLQTLRNKFNLQHIEGCYLLGLGAAQAGRRLPKFKRNNGNFYPITRRHISKDSILHSSRLYNFKSNIVIRYVWSEYGFQQCFPLNLRLSSTGRLNSSQ